jgi:hypothetical protein
VIIVELKTLRNGVWNLSASTCYGGRRILFLGTTGTASEECGSLSPPDDELYPSIGLNERFVRIRLGRAASVELNFGCELTCFGFAEAAFFARQGGMVGNAAAAGRMRVEGSKSSSKIITLRGLAFNHGIACFNALCSDKKSSLSLSSCSVSFPACFVFCLRRTTLICSISSDEVSRRPQICSDWRG